MGRLPSNSKARSTTRRSSRSNPTRSIPRRSTSAPPRCSVTRRRRRAIPRACSSRIVRPTCTRLATAAAGLLGRARTRPHSADRADVSRQRVGFSVRRPTGRRRSDHADGSSGRAGRHRTVPNERVTLLGGRADGMDGGSRCAGRCKRSPARFETHRHRRFRDAPIALRWPACTRHRSVHAWGMTEMSPIGTVSSTASELDGDPQRQREERYKAGRFAPIVQWRIVDEHGNDVATDGVSRGELLVRGFAVTTKPITTTIPRPRRHSARRLVSHRRRLHGRRISGISTSSIASKTSSNRAASGSRRSRWRTRSWAMLPCAKPASSDLRIQSGKSVRSQPSSCAKDTNSMREHLTHVAPAASGDVANSRTASSSSIRFHAPVSASFSNANFAQSIEGSSRAKPARKRKLVPTIDITSTRSSR